MSPSRKTAMLGAILVTIPLLAILIGVIGGTTGMLTGSGGVEILHADGRGIPEVPATTDR